MDLQVYTMYLFGVKKIKNNICDDNNALKQRDSMNCVRILAHILEEGRGTIKLIPFINRIFFTFNRARKPAGGPDSCPR